MCFSDLLPGELYFIILDPVLYILSFFLIQSTPRVGFFYFLFLPFTVFDVLYRIQVGE